MLLTENNDPSTLNVLLDLGKHRASGYKTISSLSCPLFDELGKSYQIMKCISFNRGLVHPRLDAIRATEHMQAKQAGNTKFHAI